MPRALRAGIEVLVEPTPGRAIDASLFPLYLYYFLTTPVLVRLDSQL